MTFNLVDSKIMAAQHMKIDIEHTRTLNSVQILYYTLSWETIYHKKSIIFTCSILFWLFNLNEFKYAIANRDKTALKYCNTENTLRNYEIRAYNVRRMQIINFPICIQFLEFFSPFLVLIFNWRYKMNGKYFMRWFIIDFFCQSEEIFQNFAKLE